jgi:hypothetical protein
MRQHPQRARRDVVDPPRRGERLVDERAAVAEGGEPAPGAIEQLHLAGAHDVARRARVERQRVREGRRECARDHDASYAPTVRPTLDDLHGDSIGMAEEQRGVSDRLQRGGRLVGEAAREVAERTGLGGEVRGARWAMCQLPGDEHLVQRADGAGVERLVGHARLLVSGV